MKTILTKILAISLLFSAIAPVAIQANDNEFSGVDFALVDPNAVVNPGSAPSVGFFSGLKDRLGKTSAVQYLSDKKTKAASYSTEIFSGLRGKLAGIGNSVGARKTDLGNYLADTSAGKYLTGLTIAHPKVATGLRYGAYAAGAIAVGYIAYRGYKGYKARKKKQNTYLNLAYSG